MEQARENNIATAVPIRSPQSVSVVIAAYNAQDTIERSIQTVLDQSHPPYEIIVVDDCSIDGTREVVERLAALDPRVRLIANTRNGGPGRCRNLGIAAAEGDWIAVQDADDAWLPERLEKLLAAAHEHQADVVADNMLLYDIGCDEIIRTGFSVKRGLRRITPVDLFQQDVQLGAEFGYGLLQPMVRKALLTEYALAYNEEIRYGEDMLLLARILCSGARAVLIPDPLYIYTTRVGERSKVKSPHSKSSPRFDLIADQIEEIKKTYGAFVSAETHKAMAKLASRYRVVHALNLARQQRQEGRLGKFSLSIVLRPSLLAHLIRQRIAMIKSQWFSG